MVSKVIVVIMFIIVVLVVCKPLTSESKPLKKEKIF
jgi:hypothetical protein